MSELRIGRDGPVMLLTLNRPAHRNALSRALRAELAAAFTAAELDGSVRALILTGEGDAFCAGLDLTELAAAAGGDPVESLRDSQALADLFTQMMRHDKPVIAAMNGAAIAAGAGLVTAADFALAAAGATIGYSEARIGFVAAIVSVMLVAQVGERHARELLLWARPVSAERAVAMGLVNEVVAPDRLLERALELARNLARNAPGSLALTKRLLLQQRGLGLDQALALAVAANAERRASAELAEGVRAFLEKREPRW